MLNSDLGKPARSLRTGVRRFILNGAPNCHHSEQTANPSSVFGFHGAIIALGQKSISGIDGEAGIRAIRRGRQGGRAR
jgi:hypothetical protein